MELISSDKRAFVSSMSFLCWSTGMCFTPMIAWLFPNWKVLVLLSVVPYIIMVYPLWKYLPESPRWLLSKKRIKECTDVILKIAKVNGKEVEKAEIQKKLMDLSEP